MDESKQELVVYKFHDLIVVHKKLSLTLCAFFDLTDFDANQYFDSSFWCALNSLGDDEWFEVTDDIIERVGYKGTAARMDNIRTTLFNFLKKHFIENMDYIFILEYSRGKNGSGGSNKFTLKMKRDSFKMLLLSANTQYSKEIY